MGTPDRAGEGPVCWLHIRKSRLGSEAFSGAQIPMPLSSTVFGPVCSLYRNVRTDASVGARDEKRPLGGRHQLKFSSNGPEGMVSGQLGGQAMPKLSLIPLLENFTRAERQTN